MFDKEFFDLEWCLEFLQLIVDGFSSVWVWLTTPIEKLLLDNGVLGIVAEVIIPDAIDVYSPIYYMCSVGLSIYIGLSIFRFIRDSIKIT